MSANFSHFMFSGFIKPEIRININNKYLIVFTCGLFLLCISLILLDGIDLYYHHLFCVIFMFVFFSLAVLHLHYIGDVSFDLSFSVETLFHCKNRWSVVLHPNIVLRCKTKDKNKKAKINKVTNEYRN